MAQRRQGANPSRPQRARAPCCARAQALDTLTPAALRLAPQAVPIPAWDPTPAAPRIHGFLPYRGALFWATAQGGTLTSTAPKPKPSPPPPSPAPRRPSVGSPSSATPSGSAPAPPAPSTAGTLAAAPSPPPSPSPAARASPPSLSTPPAAPPPPDR